MYGKTAGSGHKNKPNAKGVTFKDRGEWIVSEGSHTQLRTPEEHSKIRAILNSRRVAPKGTRKKIQVFSKLLFCGKCGKLMSFTNKKNGRTYVKTCTKADHFGNRCGNSGMNVEVIYAQLFFELKQYEQQLLNHEPNEHVSSNSSLELALKKKKEEFSKLESSVERIKDMYIEGIIDKEELIKRTEKQQSLIQTKKEEIRTVEQSLAEIKTSKNDEDRLKAIRRFKESWNSEGIEREELNKHAKEIIDRIEVIREGNDVQLNIKYL